MTTPQRTTLTGIESAQWLNDHGARFCLVSAWNDTSSSPGKSPAVGGAGWHERPLTLDQVRPHLEKGGNIGLLCGQHSGGIFLLDVDQNLPGFLAELPHYAEYPRIHAGNPDKAKFILRMQAGDDWTREKKYKRTPEDKHPFLEILWTGNQGVVPPSRHPSGSYYQLENADHEIPEVTPDMLVSDVVTWCDVMRYEAPAQPVEQPERPHTTQENGGSLREAVRAYWTPLKVFEHFGLVQHGTKQEKTWIRVLGNGGLFVNTNNETWARPGDGKGAGGDVFDAWHFAETNGTQHKLPAGQFYKTLCKMAGIAGISIPEARTIASDNSAYQQPSETGDLPTTTPTPGVFKCDDIGNGERLRVRHGRKMHWVKERGWLVWTGKVWEEDRGKVETWAKETARSIYAEAAACEDDNIAKEIAKHARATAYRGRREAMIAACASEPGIPARPDEFDRNPWLLNVENGILDLTTGNLGPHDPKAKLTRMAGTYYDPAAPCPLWLSVLDTVFAKDKDLIDFFQRDVGYSMTGSTIEQVLTFLYGTGANGKSTVTGALQDMLGNYAQKTRAETFLKKQGDQIPEDVARLAGVRFALAAELTGGHLNESLVKDLTGGDRLAARFLHQNTFEFQPVVKLWLYGNTKPTISETTEGIWRRVRLVPFAVVIPEKDRDGKLPEKLRAELPGILAWAVRGCLAWQRDGLTAPDKVKDATKAYRDEQDDIGRFLAECCTIQDGLSTTAGAAYDAYKKWGGGWSQRRFSQAMTDRGHKTEGRDSNGRAIYPGMGLIDTSTGEAQTWQR